MRSQQAAGRAPMPQTLLLACSLLGAALAPCAAVPAPLAPQQQLSPLPLPPHPRLLALPADMGRLRRSSSAEAKQAQAKLQAHGELLMQHGGQALEGASLDLVYTMGVLHRLNGSVTSRWSNFAIKNLVHVCSSPDICHACCSDKGCNCTAAEANGGRNAAPRQVSLCTGNLGQALGIAYDWFYHAMSEAERFTIRCAITTQVLNLYSQGLSAGFVGSIWWRTSGNFNGCINGGAFIASLAVLDEDGFATPDRVPGSTIAQFARDTIQLSLISMQRLQGGVTIFREGYDYGSFGFGSYITAVRAAETTFGADSAIAKLLAPQHTELHRNRLYNIGASGEVYNWADSSACGGSNGSGCYYGFNTNEWQAMAMARRFADPALAFVARRRALDPRSPCEPGAGGAEKGHLKYDCALAVRPFSSCA